MVDPTAKIGKGCRIGPNVVIGPGCVIGDGVSLQRCVLLEDSKVKDHAWVKSTIVGKSMFLAFNSATATDIYDRMEIDRRPLGSPGERHCSG